MGPPSFLVGICFFKKSHVYVSLPSLDLPERNSVIKFREQFKVKPLSFNKIVLLNKMAAFPRCSMGRTVYLPTNLPPKLPSFVGK